MIINYLISDYLIYEKKAMDKVEDELREGNLTDKEKKTLEELAAWHFENCMRTVKMKGIPRCVQNYIYGYRQEPKIEEIQSEYQEMQEYFRKRSREQERLMLKVAIPFVIIMLTGLVILLL